MFTSDCIIVAVAHAISDSAIEPFIEARVGHLLVREPHVREIGFADALADDACGFGVGEVRWPTSSRTTNPRQSRTLSAKAATSATSRAAIIGMANSGSTESAMMP